MKGYMRHLYIIFLKEVREARLRVGLPEHPSGRGFN